MNPGKARVLRPTQLDLKFRILVHLAALYGRFFCPISSITYVILGYVTFQFIIRTYLEGKDSHEH